MTQLKRLGVILALILGAALGLGAWATASPPGSSPDEDVHLASIWCPRFNHGACEWGIGPRGEDVITVPHFIIGAAPCTANHGDWSGACVDTLQDTPFQTNMVDDGRYPGGFYAVMRLLIPPNVSSANFTDTIWLMRLVNSALAIGLLGASVALMSRPNRRLVAYGSLVVAAPMVISLVASINPSGWSIVGVFLAFVGVHGGFTEQTRWRRGGLAAVGIIGAAMATSARGDAGGLAFVAVLAACVLHFDTLRASWRRVILPAVTAAVALVGIFMSDQVIAAFAGMTANARGLDPDHDPGDIYLLVYNIFDIPAVLSDSVVGPLNWLDTPMRPITSVPILLLVGALWFIGMRRLNWRKGLAMAGLVFTFVGLPVLLLQQSGVEAGLIVQGRYVTPLVAVILMVSLWDPVRKTARRLSRPQVLIIIVALSIAHAVALWTQIRRYTTGLDFRGFNLSKNVEWWSSPVSPNATWLLGSAGFALLIGVGLWVTSARIPALVVVEPATGEGGPVAQPVVALREPQEPHAPQSASVETPDDSVPVPEGGPAQVVEPDGLLAGAEHPGEDEPDGQREDGDDHEGGGEESGGVAADEAGVHPIDDDGDAKDEGDDRE